MKTRIFQNLKFIFCLATGLCNPAIAQKTMLYPQLEKGQYDIGFKTIIDFDYSRTYNLNYPNDTSSQKHDPRPIITTIWYPAKPGKKDIPMLYGDYLNIQTQEVTLKTFTARVRDYNSKNSSYYMFYKDSLNEEQKRQLVNHLNQRINVYKDATPVNGKFPLVIYHAGLGGTLNDNTILCEYLASHGFVAITGAFQSSDYKNMNLNWDLERSTKDIDFMLNRIKNMPFIDFSKIAAIGHSYGAQAVLGYRTEDFSPVSWLIIIDSTFDYSLDANPENFSVLTEKLYRKIKNVSAPMLVFANPPALFKVIDSLKYADRIYCTVDLEHNDFTSLTALAKQNGLIKQEVKDSIWTKYTWVANQCLNYLKYNIYKDQSAKEFVLSKRSLTNVYEVSKGSKLGLKVPEYLDYSKPPSRLQFLQLVADKNVNTLDKVIVLYPDEDLINRAGYSVLKKDVDFAIYLFKKNVERYPESWNVWDSLAEGYMVKGEKELAIKHYNKSMELNPKNTNGLRMLEKLKK